MTSRLLSLSMCTNSIFLGKPSAKTIGVTFLCERGYLFELASMGIPHIIHQIWYQGEHNIPPQYVQFQRTWKEHHSDWKYMLWSEKSITELIEKEYSWFMDTFNSYSLMIQKIDAAKYFILHSFGGVYVDLDIECIRNIEHELKEESLVVSASGHPWIEWFSKTVLNTNIKLNNAFIATEKEHPVLKESISRLPECATPKGWRFTNIYIVQTAGPSFWSDRIDWALQHNFRVKILDSNVMEAESRAQCTNDTCCIHYFHGNWGSYFQVVLSNPLETKMKQRVIYWILTTCSYMFFRRGSAVIHSKKAN